MTRSELTLNLRSLSSGTIASVIGSDKYVVIDRSVSSAILYAIEQASDDEIKLIEDLSGVLSFLYEHRKYRSVSLG